MHRDGSAVGTDTTCAGMSTASRKSAAHARGRHRGVDITVCTRRVFVAHPAGPSGNEQRRSTRQSTDTRDETDVRTTAPAGLPARSHTLLSDENRDDVSRSQSTRCRHDDAVMTMPYPVVVAFREALFVSPAPATVNW